MATRERPKDLGICTCGCGGQIPWRPHHKRRLPRFIRGHSSRLVDYTTRRAKLPEGWIAPSGLCECGCGDKTPISTRTDTQWGRYAGYPIRFIKGHNPRRKRDRGDPANAIDPTKATHIVSQLRQLLTAMEQVSHNARILQWLANRGSHERSAELTGLHSIETASGNTMGTRRGKT